MEPVAQRISSAPAPECFLRADPDERPFGFMRVLLKGTTEAVLTRIADVRVKDLGIAIMVGGELDGEPFQFGESEAGTVWFNDYGEEDARDAIVQSSTSTSLEPEEITSAMVMEAAREIIETDIEARTIRQLDVDD